MSWLLFLDESGHDHKHCPYEVRGGVALHASKLWPFVQRVKQAELEAFGARLHDYKKELKGSKLLDKDRFKWAAQDSELSPDVRQRNSRGFLTKGLEKKPPTKAEFTAYGQASLLMARLVFDALKAMDARVFASVIPASVIKPAAYVAQDFLRKDHVFLLERYFYFLEKQNQHGLLVMDEVEKVSDRRFVRQMDKYFSQTATGRHRTSRIVPVPMFVASDMSLPVQAADLVIYCINWGYRNETIGLLEPTREDVASGFALRIDELQHRGQAYRDGRVFNQWGICYVRNPYRAAAQ
jgi:hypothetical protein